MYHDFENVVLSTRIKTKIPSFIHRPSVHLRVQSCRRVICQPGGHSYECCHLGLHGHFPISIVFKAREDGDDLVLECHPHSLGRKKSESSALVKCVVEDVVCRGQDGDEKLEETVMPSCGGVASMDKRGGVDIG